MPRKPIASPSSAAESSSGTSKSRTRRSEEVVAGTSAKKAPSPAQQAMLKLGLRRTYAGDDGFDSEGAGAYTKTYRFGRKIDKRTMRLID